jgi:DNA mismatch repair protein MutS
VSESPIIAANNAELLAKATPMMRQYLSVKSENPTSIVLFRMGDFFETFYEDAADCARLLDLTLTARSKEKDPIPMAGVPHHAVDGYIARLVELGRTVVLVDQVEDPKLAKGLVKREVTEVLSPGTFLDPQAPPRVSTYLAALALEKELFGLAVLDLSTGELRATSGKGEDLLFDELERIGAREVLVSANVLGTATIERLRKDLTRTALTPVPEDSMSLRAAKESLTRTFSADETKALEQVLAKEAMRATGAALAYVEKLQPKRDGLRLHHIREVRPYLPGNALVLDTDARAHLELFRTAGDGGRRGSLIGAIDEAVTAMGGRLFARWLAYPLRELEPITARQDAIECFVKRPSALDGARMALKEIADLERLAARVVMGRATPRDLGTLAVTLERTPAILETARVAGSALQPNDELKGMGETRAVSSRLAKLGAADACADVAAAIQQALIEEPPVDLEAGEVFRAGYDPELDRLTELSRDGKSLIAAMEAKEKEETGISSLKVRYNRVFGYYIEVTKPNLKLVPKHYIRKQTTANGERFFTEALRELESQVLSAEEKRISRTHHLFNDLVLRTGHEARRIGRLAEALAEIDVLAALALIAENRGWARPLVDREGVVEIADGRHPVIELLSAELGERFVPNDITLRPENHLLIITGPNMAGKSTIMRQTALIVILAHMGSFVPVRAARIGLVDRIFTRVGASDDLSRGRSTFMVEMNETSRILRSATKDSLILLDEIGRGTSTFDGLSIAWAVAEHLHDAVGAKTLFATHYHELTDICRDKTRALNVHVAVKEYNDNIVFLRKLMPGPTNKSYGVQVARLAGLPKSVVERARTVLARLEAQALSGGRHSSDQLSLFAPPAKDAVIDELVEKLDALDVDDLTPRQALDRLAELKEIAQKKKKR